MERKAFTLAEVLITLGIIGVVAALTLPTLIQNHKKTVAETRLKKFYSTMQQAIKMSEIENGESADWVKVSESEQYDENGNYSMAKNRENSKTFFNKYLAPYMKYVGTTENENYFKVMFADGSTVSIHNGGCIDFIYDINGDRNPNVIGRDIFKFLMCFGSNRISFYGRSDISFTPYMYYHMRTHEKLLEFCTQNSNYCSGLIYFDGWKISDDYPYKL